MFDRKTIGHSSHRFGAVTDEQADALYIANQIEFARAMVVCAQRRYDTGEIAAADGARDEAERAVNQMMQLASGLDNIDPGLHDEIRAVRESIRHLRRTSWKPQ